MLNYIWAALIVLAVVMGGVSQTLPQVTEGAFDAAKTAVMGLALPLIGVMALWLGLMRLAERAGLIQLLARGMRPVLSWLFPEIPRGHPALGSMLMNFAANMLGLSNAATPLGLKAMKDLESLNPHPGTATNAMCTFLAINTSSIQLIPASTIALLAAAKSTNPSAIVGTALMATFCSTLVGITAVKLLQVLPWFAPPVVPVGVPASVAPISDPASSGVSTESRPLRALTWLVVAAVLGFFGFLFWRLLGQGSAQDGSFTRWINSISLLAVPFSIVFLVLFALTRGVRVYEEFVEGAKEGFETGIRIIPYLVAMLVAVGMFRAAGGVDWVTRALQPALVWLHFPSELVPLALMRPLSGSGANGIFLDLVNAHGPDSLIARMGATLIGSTETTFYVIALYFGSVGVRRTRHAIAAGLLADLAGVLASVAICRWVFAG